MIKNDRQRKILEIISENIVSTQQELTRLLNKEGFKVTQATTSRDLQELRIIKSSVNDGTYKYVVAKDTNSNISDKLNAILTQSVLSVDYAGNIVVVKTISGAAQAAGYAIDSFSGDEMLGSIAGDDTIMIVNRSEKSAQKLAAKLLGFAK